MSRPVKESSEGLRGDEARSGGGRQGQLPLVVAAVGIVGVGLEWLAVQVMGIPVLPTESPAASAAPVASPSASARPTPVAAASPTPTPSYPLAASDPSLPEAFALPDGIWETTGPGWVLATYAPSVPPTDPATLGEAERMGPQVMYLIAPDGARFEVLRMDQEVPIHLQSWTAGEDHAYIDACSGSSCPSDVKSTALLDLTTGEISSLGALGDGSSVMATLPGSYRVWSRTSGLGFVEHDGVATSFEGDWAPSRVSPTGEYVSLQKQVEVEPPRQELRAAIALTTSGALIPLQGLDPAASCSPRQWVAPASLVVACTTDGASIREFLADPATGAVTPVANSDPAIGPDSPSVENEFWIEPGVWAGGYAANDYERDSAMAFDGSAAGVSDHGTIGPIPLVNPRGAPFSFANVGAAIDHTLYVEGWVSEGAGSLGTSTLVSYDLRTGYEVVLLSDPAVGPVASAVSAPDVLVTAITSWVVAP